MLKALGFGAALQILCMIIAIKTGNIDQAGHYAEYLAFGLLTLAGLMVYNALSAPSAYYKEHEVQDYKSRWKWTFYFLLASVPSGIFAVIFFSFFA
ncbi:hypothetical protein HPY28_24960 [Brevibacillus sp. HB1.2]|uniref:hypothetical protein n=1 Tax=Brevibacillus TaxID=55080 RepID=UPI00156BC6C0|nr:MULTISPECIES: hypothetical protein [unclassified Brevibacillus]NRS17870.1 hypothetical protein [Brevibacillus sp. HB1.4B]NTU23575.1 hypothetical protein [Brevibacillus sp. HB1.2]NTU31782.1 hypothetical protein [Brevibacillus sp. HB1.1]